ncbi:MAG: hypothetical protein O7C98_01485 [Planctomycetota bacterium]|nr:hypothetical protein [Planctomycetota bacterium]
MSVRLPTALLCALAFSARADSWTPQEGFRKVATRLQELRGLKLDDRLQLEVIPRTEWHKRVAAQPTKTNEPYAVLWRTLGIVPAGQDADEAYDEVRRRYRGYYHLSDDRLVYFTDTPAELREPQLAHALMHAVQARHSRLFNAPPAIDGYFDDVNWARAAAKEGEAVLHELSWPTGSLDGMRDKIEALPERLDIEGCEPYAVRWTYHPYVAGARYLLAHAKGGLRDACDALYLNPPVSTEQVLHPERNDPPLAVIVPDLSDRLGAGWKLAARTVLGEWTIADWVWALRPDTAPKPLSVEQIGGGLPDDLRWGGDQAQVYQDGERFLVVVWTVWDDEASAVRFRKLLGSTKSARAGPRVAVLCGPAQVHRGLLTETLRDVRTTAFRSVEQLEEILAGD